jgi:hypothetical protein
MRKQARSEPPPGGSEVTPSTTRTHGRERRVSVRYPGHTATACQVRDAQDEPLLPALVLDLGCGGLGLVLACRLTPGAELACELRNPARGVQLARTLRVIHGTQQGTCWVHGCAFDRPLSELELDALC